MQIINQVGHLRIPIIIFMVMGLTACSGNPAEDYDGECYPHLEITRYSANWPEGTREEGVKGEVTVRVTLNDDGQLYDARIIDSDPEGVFDQAALDSVEQWDFDWHWDAEPCAYEFDQIMTFRP